MKPIKSKEFQLNHTLLLVNKSRVPKLLKSIDRWVVWGAFHQPGKERFSKVPVDPLTGVKVNAHDQRNHMQFEEAFEHYKKKSSDGIGFVLDGKPIFIDGHLGPKYIIGLDLDKTNRSPSVFKQTQQIIKAVGSYWEHSPSATGFRIFALSKIPLGRGQSDKGEMYYRKKFLTVTGNGPRIEPIDATNSLKNIADDWWPVTQIIPPSALSLNPFYPDTPRKRAELSSMLEFISSDCSYERYRDVVWGILSTGWSDAEEIAKKWCVKAPERFEAQSFDTVVTSYNANHNNPITIGSIKYWAREGGWT